MPTGYTAGVADGKVTDLRTFVLQCARNFGACIMQRDDPQDSLPKLREVSEYSVQSAKEAAEHLANLTVMSLEDAEQAAQEEYDTRLTSRRKYAENRTETRNRYNAMLVEVMRWTPPTPEHASLKKFMIDQLTESRRFDTDFSEEPPRKRDAATWLKEETERARERADDAVKRLGEERERVAKANEWITVLYESLEPVPA